MTSTSFGVQSHNMRLLAHDQLRGFGGIGEGISIQVMRDGRRILWLAHERAPKNFTGIDVSDPRRPHVIVQTELPHANMRSNSLESVNDLLVVAYQTTKRGDQPAGMELFDISDPVNPRSISFFDASGPASRGVHQLWFADGEFVHVSSGAPDFEPHHASDDQIYRIIDVRKPSRPTEVGRWWLPGTRKGDAEPPPPRNTAVGAGQYRTHNTNVYPQRPDRAYLGYLDAGAIILDISDKGNPKVVSRWDNSPPYPGFTHTVLPLFERNLMVVSDESIVDRAEDWPKLVWVLDAREEKNPIPISTLPAPPPSQFQNRRGRFGAHNLHENKPGPGNWQSERYILGTFFSGGVRVYDIADPYRPNEVAYYVPDVPPGGSPAGDIQINDVFVDDRSIVYATDRFTGGLYVLELNV